METIGTPPLTRNGNVLTFDDPAEAALVAKDLRQAGLNEKLCVKPVIDDEWRMREQTRVVDGTYRPLPWHNSGWWNADTVFSIHKDHFAHASLEKPGYIAYTKNEEDGAKDKQTLLRPGAYLNKYFEKSFRHYGYSERQLVDQFMKMYGPIDVNFATTEDEILHVYDQVATCLYGKHWPNNIHPATLYAAGDLQIAYLGKMDGRITARTVVWPERKIHSRVYGDIARLTQGLQRLGYKWGAPIGARLKRIQYRETKFAGGAVPSGCFLAPYIDKKNQQGGGHLSVKDNGEHLIICAEGELGSHHCGGADGLSGQYVPRADEHPTYSCDRCEEAGFLQVNTIYTDSPEDGNDGDIEMWCDNCRDNHSNYCEYSGRNFTNDVPVVEVGGHTWIEYYADMYAQRCEGNGELYMKDDLKRVHFPDGTVKKLSHPYIRDHLGRVYKSELTNYFFPANEIAQVMNGVDYRHICSKAELKQRAFQCDGCDTYWVLEYRRQPFDDDRLYCPTCATKIKNGDIPISKSRKAFEAQHLIAAE
jgi:hypothetical protein